MRETQYVEWTDTDGGQRQGRNQLTEMKERELRSHAAACPRPVARCADCWLVYRNIGNAEWNRLVAALYESVLYQFECNECGELVTTPNNDMHGANCREIAERDGDDQCPGEMQFVDFLTTKRAT